LRDDAFGGNPEQDITITYLANALFLPIDMTDYEDAFSGSYHTLNRIPHLDTKLNNRELNGWADPHELSQPIIEDADLPQWGLTPRH